MAKKVMTKKEIAKKIDDNIEVLPAKIDDVLSPEDKQNIKELGEKLQNEANELLGGEGLANIMSEFFENMKIISTATDTNSETLILLQKQNKWFSIEISQIKDTVNEIYQSIEGLTEILRDIYASKTSS